MTEHGACANGESLPALMQYIQDCQDMAARLTGLIEAAEILQNEDLYGNGVTTLLAVSVQMANELTVRLDSQSLLEVTP